jgi:hypothetical protein
VEELTVGYQVNTQCGIMYPWKHIRLPKDLHPDRYKLWIHPNLTTLKFAGTVEIDVHVTKETNLVVLHQQGLNITYFTLHVDSQSIPIRLVCLMPLYN